MQSTSGRLLVRSGYLELLAEVLKFRDGLVKLASEHVETVMPHYTRFQHGQTTTFGHYLMGFVRALERDFERLVQAFRRCNVSSMGCGAGTGSEFLLNRKRTAELMGFSSVLTNTKDAYAFMDFGIEAFTAMSILMTNIDRVATDLLIWYTYEFSFIDFADRYCGTSSIMAQKKNPHGLMYVTENISKLLGRMTGAIVQYRNVSGLGSLKEVGFSFELTRALAARHSGNHDDHGSEDSAHARAIDCGLGAVLGSGRSHGERKGTALAHRLSDRRHPCAPIHRRGKRREGCDA